MTIRFLRRGTMDLPMGTIRTLDPATESALVASGEAVSIPTPNPSGDEQRVLYDPTTGNLIAADGTPIQFSASGDGYCWGSRGSGLPFVMPSSGNVNNTSGNVTASTAFDYVIGPSYTYFPTNALYAASPAGWYYTVWTAASIGTVYANTYLNGNAQIPANPTPLTTVAGAYTQATGFDVAGPNFVIPGNVLGPNGCILWDRIVNNNNSAGAKAYNTYFGGVIFQGLSQTTNPKEAGTGTIRNRGRATQQVAANAAHGDSNAASAVTKLSLDTTQPQTFAMAIQLAAATDYAIIESHGIKIFYGA